MPLKKRDRQAVKEKDRRRREGEKIREQKVAGETERERWRKEWKGRVEKGTDTRGERKIQKNTVSDDW